MGVPFYGYDWATGVKTTEVTGVRAYELLDTYHQTSRWDETAQTYWFEYKDAEGVLHTAYFEHERTLSESPGPGQEMGIAGISVWRLGDEASGYWAPLQRYKDGR